jgi:hypothetical protein
MLLMNPPTPELDEVAEYYSRKQAAFSKEWTKRNQLREELAKAIRAGASEKAIRALEKAFKAQNEKALNAGYTGD